MATKGEETEGDGLDAEVLSMIPIEENVYSDVVLCVARRQLVPTVSSFVVLLLNAAVQLMFALVLVPAIIGDDVTDYTDMDDYGNFFTLWRNSTHGFKAPYLAGQTRGEWVCTGNDFSWMGQAVSDMQAYSTENLGMSNGTMFSSLCCLIWLVMVLKEIRASCTFALLMMMSNTPPGGRDYTYDRENKVGRLTSLSREGKMAVLLCFLLRVVINGALLIYGLKFLAYTWSLTDFVLNSVALAFIYDLDELFFQVLLTHEKQYVIQTLEPPVLPAGRSKGLISKLRPFTEIGMLTIAVTGTALTHTLLTSTFVSGLINDVYKEICVGGVQEGRGPGELSEA
eukprot:TRINITY_DN72530_c0_g1_i1.p1 TRINITY_DN72530_c0_g1~~TRINITY_DN72530_c0_g1_i1.p1  ORF type:complete len:362 (-),score=50.89 TRINITY_DN72530_c0_g1_i1:32-1051(-)